MWEEQEEWGEHWTPPHAARSDPDYLISKWLKDQNPNYQSQIDLEVKWEAEAAEREQILRDYHWSKEESAGGIVSNLLRALFVPKKIRNVVRRLEQFLWQRMLTIAPDVIWGVLFAVLVSGIVMSGPVVSWEDETTARTIQAITCSATMYWATCSVLVRVINDWRFRRRLRWWAAQGYTEAEFSLGSLYEAGDGIPANPKMAAHWFHKAARHGHCEAQYMLGECYFRGYGVPVNLREARKWFQRAANQGDADAETMEEYIKKMLETCGENGTGSKTDMDQLLSRRYNSGDSPGKSSKNPSESDELRKQRKEEQRKEYERMETVRKQKEQEKRKAKADKLKKERQVREEEEAAAARQAAQIAALVAEEQRQRQGASSPSLDKSKGGKASDASAKNGRSAGSKHTQPAPKAVPEPKQKPGTADAAAELVAQQERLSAKAQPLPSRSAKASATATPATSATPSRRSEDTSRHNHHHNSNSSASGNKAGKDSRGGGNSALSPSSSCSSLSSLGPAVPSSSSAASLADRSPRVRSSGGQNTGHDLQRSSSTASAGGGSRSTGGAGPKEAGRQNSWPPKKTNDFKTRSREEQVAALTVPPPPPPPRRQQSLSSSPEQPQLQPQPQPQPQPRSTPSSTSVSAMPSPQPSPQRPSPSRPGSMVPQQLPFQEPPISADDLSSDQQQLNASTNSSMWSPEKLGADLWGQGLGWTPLGGNGLSLSNGLGALGNTAADNGSSAAAASDPLDNLAFHGLSSSTAAQFLSNPLSNSLENLAAHYMQRGTAPAISSADPVAVPPSSSAMNSMQPPSSFESTFGGGAGVDSHMWGAFGGALGGAGIPSVHSGKPMFIDSEEDNVCPVCLDRKPGGAKLVPCGHTQLCLPCAKGLLGSTQASCPYCFSLIEEIVELRSS